LSLDIERGYLGVAGGSFSLLLPRNYQFAEGLHGIALRYPEPVNRSCVLDLLQLLWDRGEPAGYMDAVTSNTLTPDTPPKRVLLQYGLGDAEVTWLGCHALSRTLGASMFPDNVREDGEVLFGFPVIPASPNDDLPAVVVGFNFSAPDAPVVNLPASTKTNTHDCTRRDPRGLVQLQTFLSTGTFVDVCGGKSCDPIEPPITLASCPLPD